VVSLQPRLVGLSLTSSEFDAASKLTAKLREWLPDTIILWGGVHPTIEPEACAQIADYVCIGEGEQTMLDVAESVDNGKDLRQINNLAWLENGQLNKNPLYPLVEDLNQFPTPHRIPANSYIQVHDAVQPLDPNHLRKHSLFKGTLYRTITSRGCPFHCTYCCNNHYHRLYPNWGMRYLSAERVIQGLEMAISRDPVVEYISFMDDCFFSSERNRFIELCEQYKKRIGKPFMMKASPHRVSDDYMRTAVDAGLAFLHVGLQSGSERVCREVFKRGASPKVFRKAAEIIHKYPVAPWYDIIMDNPFETLAERIETIETLTDLPRPYYLQAYSLTFYAGTELRERALREFPELVQDPTKKDFLAISGTPVNHLKALAPVFPRALTRRLTAAFKAHPNSSGVKALIAAARILSWTMFQPIHFARLLMLSQQGKLWRTLQILPYWLDLRAITVFNFFHRSKDSTIE
jgi:radical SAM superfamily enzyme YgiQ (UPF0313 family)